MSNSRQTGGVLGGLGPLATVSFLQQVIDATAVTVEQEHVDLIVSQRASTPDRTAALLHGGPTPAPQMARDARMLQDAGAQFIVIPCNTASNFLGAVERAVSIPVVSIVNETIDEVMRRLPQATTVGLMATDGTIQSGIYAEAAKCRGLQVVLPDEDLQRRIMAMIYEGVKIGRPVDRDEFYACIDALRDQGADAVISGCTEISVLCAQYGPTPPYVVDSLDALARRTVLLAGASLKEC
ncbi:aspartate/glutamate racemase family protein [Schaalia suimastitidis]|uniref:aspartate/glutamate racemase family protein n=1 Tax=Schaalia suimastitidis TaxID=121163 RepID=UPI0004178520|nr:amino acid racemase [Schaalia suimastitidis]